MTNEEDFYDIEASEDDITERGDDDSIPQEDMDDQESTADGSVIAIDEVSTTTSTSTKPGPLPRGKKRAASVERPQADSTIEGNVVGGRVLRPKKGRTTAR